MKEVNTFLTNLGNDKLLLALFSGVIIIGIALISIAVVAIALYF